MEEGNVVRMKSNSKSEDRAIYSYRRDDEDMKIGVDVLMSGVDADVECGPFKINVSGSWRSIFETVLDIFAPKLEEKDDEKSR